MIDPQIHEAKTALEQLSKDRMAQQLAFDRQLEINSHRRALEMAKEEGEAKGRAEGEARGRAALVTTIEQLCQSCGVELTLGRRATLKTASLDELRRVVNSIAVDRVWPE